MMAASAARTKFENNGCVGEVVTVAAKSVTTAFQLLRACPEISRFDQGETHAQAAAKHRRMYKNNLT
jgi:hypothetical protein